MTCGPNAPPPSAPRVLVLEDHDDLLELITETLRDEGFAVPACATVSAANRALVEVPVGGQPLALLPIDAALPDGSGLDVIRAARGKGLPAPAVRTTGRDAADIDDAAIAELGVTSILHKASDDGTLVRAVRPRLDPARPRRPASPIPRSSLVLRARRPSRTSRLASPRDGAHEPFGVSGRRRARGEARRRRERRREPSSKPARFRALAASSCTSSAAVV